MTYDREEQFGPGKLWGLWDMLRTYAEYFFLIGQSVHDARLAYLLDDNFEVVSPNERRLNEKGRAELRDDIETLSLLSNRLGLTVSLKMLDRRLAAEEYPQTVEEFDVLVEVVQDELSARQFMFVPPHKAEFYENDSILADRSRKAFPKAHQELMEGATCFALGRHTACVFHCMRALEHALRALAAEVGKAFEVQNWHNIIDQIEAEIRAVGDKPKSVEKNAQIQFLSEAAAEFRYFKDGWRNHVSRNKVSYKEAQAQKIMEHVCDFIEALSTRLNEPV